MEKCTKHYGEVPQQLVCRECRVTSVVKTLRPELFGSGTEEQAERSKIEFINEAEIMM